MTRSYPQLFKDRKNIVCGYERDARTSGELNPDYTPKQAKAFMEKLADQAKQQIQKNSGNVKNTKL